MIFLYSVQSAAFTFEDLSSDVYGSMIATGTVLDTMLEIEFQKLPYIPRGANFYTWPFEDNVLVTCAEQNPVQALSSGGLMPTLVIKILSNWSLPYFCGLAARC